jgi:hypothetical protein
MHSIAALYQSISQSAFQIIDTIGAISHHCDTVISDGIETLIAQAIEEWLNQRCRENVYENAT